MIFTNLFFDLDGTLIDSRPGIFNSVFYTLEKLQIPEIDWPSDLNPFIGPPLRNSFKSLFGFDDAMAELATLTYREYYGRQGLYEFEVYEGIPEALHQLSDNGFKLSLVTSKAEIYAVKIAEKAGFTALLETVSGCEISGQRSEKAELIIYTLEKLGLEPSSKILMIGDRNYDIIGARLTGISSAAVLYGYGSSAELAVENPDIIFASPQEMVTKLI